MIVIGNQHLIPIVYYFISLGMLFVRAIKTVGEIVESVVEGNFHYL